MSDEPNVDRKRVKTRQHALHHWLGVSDFLCHKPYAQSMLDKLPSDEMVFRYDREVSQCQRKSTLIERFDKQSARHMRTLALCQVSLPVTPGRAAVSALLPARA